MTSNLGSEYILENKENSDNLVLQELKHTFKPEFINRIDEIIIFNSLSINIIDTIVDKLIKEVESRLKDKNIRLNLSSNAKKAIIDNSYDINFGARPIKRYIQRNIESLIANNIIQDKIKLNSTITIDYLDNNFILN